MVSDIFDEIYRMQEEMDRMFNEFMYPSRQLVPRSEGEEVKPEVPSVRKALVDVQETDKDIIVTAELPGVEREDIQLNATTERLEIQVKKKEEQKEEKEGYRMYGSRYTGYYRSVPLPAAVDPEKVKATHKNGVLEVILPKKEPSKPNSATID